MSFNTPPFITANVATIPLGGTGRASITQMGILLGNGTNTINTVSLSNNQILGCIAFGTAPVGLSSLPIAIQQAITNLSTVTTGTWNASPITSTYIDSTLTSKT